MTVPSIIETGAAMADPVTITPQELASFDRARRSYMELRGLLLEAVAPALGGARHPVNARIYDLLQEVHAFSGGFLARHRAEMERAVTEKEVRA